MVYLPLKHPDLHWCFQAQSPLLSFFKRASKVRALSSAGVTRLHRSYDPLRLPDRPSSYRGGWRRDLHQHRVSPNYPDHLSYMPCSVPRRIEQVRVGFLPCSRGLPRLTGGSASTISLRRNTRGHSPVYGDVVALSDRLNRHQFVAKLTGLPLELLLKPLLSVFVPRGPDAVIVFDLFGDESVEDDGDLVCGSRYPGRWPKLGFHAA
jgi:hypothetical protein